MDEYEFQNPQMVTKVNHRLRGWWMDIKRDREREIRQLLGGLTYLIFVTPNPRLTRDILEFGDPVRMVFKFTNYNLTPIMKKLVVSSISLIMSVK